MHLICIDGSKFKNRENPAPEIYDSMLEQGCPRYHNGKPETMQELNVYCNLRKLPRRKSDKRLVLVFYDSCTPPLATGGPTPPNPPLPRGGNLVHNPSLATGGTTPPNPPLPREGTEGGVGFSDAFLYDLSNFDGAICVVRNSPNIPLQSFSPYQPHLVDAIARWIKGIALEN